MNLPLQSELIIVDFLCFIIRFMFSSLSYQPNLNAIQKVRDFLDLAVINLGWLCFTYAGRIYDDMVRNWKQIIHMVKNNIYFIFFLIGVFTIFSFCNSSSASIMAKFVGMCNPRMWILHPNRFFFEFDPSHFSVMFSEHSKKVFTILIFKKNDCGLREGKEIRC